MNNEQTIKLTLQHGSGPFEVPASLEKNTVLYFMRAQNCAQCNRHARELDQLAQESQKHGLDTIIIVPEDMEAAQKVKDRNRLSVPVMAGNGAAHALAGLEKKMLGVIQQSGTIVVDRAGKVLYQHIATNPEGSFSRKDFEAYLATLA